MTLEESFLIVKPDAFRRKLRNTILQRITGEGLRMLDSYQTDLGDSLAELATREHYVHVREKYAHEPEVFERILVYFRQGPILVARVQGLRCVDKLRSLCGDRADPPLCKPGSIRYDYGADSVARASAEKRAVENLVHSSDCPEAAEKELDLWFRQYLPVEYR